MRVAAVIYGEQSGIISRIVHCDSLAELAAPTVLAKGEAILIIDPSDIKWLDKGAMRLPNLKSAKALVEAERGRAAEPNRVIKIDDKTGEIIASGHADPTVDKVEGATLFQHPEADIGWTVGADGEYQRPKSGG